MSTDAPNTARRLSTGESVRLFERADWPLERRWEAEVCVRGLPGPADHHATGTTPDEAVACLESYVATRRMEEDLDA